jgi:hypothetical protein
MIYSNHYLSKFLKISFLGSIFLGVVIIFVWSFNTISTPTLTNDDTTEQVLQYNDFLSFINFHFSYNTSITQKEFTGYYLECGNPSRIDRIVASSTIPHSYCRTKPTIKDLSVGFSWKPEKVTKQAFEKMLIQRFHFFSRTKITTSATYTCATDNSYIDTTGMGGILSDCEISQGGNNNKYYVSMFYFYPKNNTTLDQVIDIESKTPNSKDFVKMTIRNIIKKIHS